MFRNSVDSQRGSAALGFALAFPLIAFIFVSVTDLVTRVLQRELATTIARQQLQHEVRLPDTHDLVQQVESALLARDFDIDLTATISQRNQAKLIELKLKSDEPLFSSRVFGVYEQSNE